MLSRVDVSSGLPDFAEIAEQSCLTAALYHEARGESETGQLAVARVIINRARSRAYPPSICGVVFQNAERKNRCQFSFACDGHSDSPKNPEIRARIDRLAWTILRDRGTVDAELARGPYKMIMDATHYHTRDVRPGWAGKLTPIGTIGHHIFYRSERVMGRI